MNSTLRPLALAGTLALAAIGCHHETKSADEGFGSLTVDQVEAMVNAHSASIYDNNSQERWQKSHVPGAKWVQFDEVKASDLPTDKTANLVFYCANTH